MERRVEGLPGDERKRGAARRIAGLCHSGLGWGDLLRGVRDELQRAVGFDASVLYPTDPATLLFSSAVVDGLERRFCAVNFALELGPDDVGKYVDLVRHGDHVSIHGASTLGRPDSSPRYREFMVPQGLGRELRAAFVLGGECFAAAALYRALGAPDFTDADAELVSRVGPHVAEGIRKSLLVEPDARLEGDDAPGVLLFDEAGRLVSCDEGGLRWLSELEVLGLPTATPADAAVVLTREVVAGRAPPGRLPRMRARTRAGRWVVLHGSAISGERGDGARYSVIVAPATPSELAPIVVRYYGLSEREQCVLRLVLRGHSSKEIAHAMRISPYTVRDHLVRIFDKTGARSRGELAARVFGDHYRPRLEAGAPPPVGRPAGGIA